MENISYRPLIEEMVWSYSRIESFDSCPYSFFLRYISKCKNVKKFYASYGTWMHEIIERYYTGDLSKDEMLIEFLIHFQDEVTGVRPKESTVQKYIEGGTEYLKTFKPFPYDTIAIEKTVNFMVDGMRFTGRIDYIGRDGDDLYIIDNKSGDIRPRSKRKKPTVKDKELDKKLRQLYLYSAPVKEKYGQFPKALCFNCFRTGVFIEEEFNIDAYNEAIDWAKRTIELIKREEEFLPKPEFFFCKYICSMSEDCVYDQMS